MALGRPELAEAPDEELEKAHDEHLIAVQNSLASTVGASGESTIPRGMPASAKVPDASEGNVGIFAPVALSKVQKSAEFRRLVNELTRGGVALDQACRNVAVLHPELTNERQLPSSKTNFAQRSAEKAKRDEAQLLIKEMTDNGIEYDEAFASIQNSHPQLFQA